MDLKGKNRITYYILSSYENLLRIIERSNFRKLEKKIMYNRYRYNNIKIIT